MRCTSCETENSADSKFCMTCGAKLAVSAETTVSADPASAPPPTNGDVALGLEQPPPPPSGDVQAEEAPVLIPVEPVAEPVPEVIEPPTATADNPWLAEDDEAPVPDTSVHDSASAAPGDDTDQEVAVADPPAVAEVPGTSPESTQAVVLDGSVSGGTSTEATDPSVPTGGSESAVLEASTVPDEDVTAAPAPAPVEELLIAAPPTEAVVPPLPAPPLSPPPSEMRLPLPTAPGSTWAPLPPVEGMPTSLMPPPGSAPLWVEHPPPPGSMDPMVIASPPPPAAADPPPVASPPPPVKIESGDPDGHDIARLMVQLSAATRPHAEVPTVIASALLNEGERAELIVPGLVDGLVGIVMLTPSRVLVVNARQWSPVVVDFPIQPGLTVQGWQDDTYAQLTFEDGQVARIEAIIDKPLAFDLARLVRERVSGLTTGN